MAWRPVATGVGRPGSSPDLAHGFHRASLDPVQLMGHGLTLVATVIPVVLVMASSRQRASDEMVQVDIPNGT